MGHKVHQMINEELSNSSVCYVLITCQKAAPNGDMQVEMTYEGDAALASYLLQGAQVAIDEQEENNQQQKIFSIGG